MGAIDHEKPSPAPERTSEADAKPTKADSGSDSSSADAPGAPTEPPTPADPPAQPEPPRRKPRLARRIRRVFKRIGVWLAVLIVPPLYRLYCWLVVATSKLDDGLTGPLLDARDRHGRVVCVLWHQEVSTVAYLYRHLHGHTLASLGDWGEVITALLRSCNFTVFRGGSSKGRARRKRVAVTLIRHMETSPVPVIYGITCDGSQGPRYRMKHGGAFIAKRCRAPLYVVRAWYSRRLEADTWDRTALPLPCGRIWMRAVGPYWIDPEGTQEDFDAALAHAEAELLDLCARSFKVLDGAETGEWRDAFPEGWEPRWAPDQLGIPRTPHDLRPEDPPAWAHMAISAEGAKPGAAEDAEATAEGAAS